jgi:hypothetical protein
MPLKQIVRPTESLTISALRGSAAERVLYQLPKLGESIRTAVAFPDPWKHGHVQGLVTRVKEKPTNINLHLLVVERPEDARGVFLADSNVTRFSTKGKVDEVRGLTVLKVSSRLADDDAQPVACNILVVLASCNRYVEDEQGRQYPDPHGILNRPKKRRNRNRQRRFDRGEQYAFP